MLKRALYLLSLPLALILPSISLANPDFGPARPISVNSQGALGNQDAPACSLSAAARYVAFQSTASNLNPNATNGKSQIFLRDRRLNQTILVSATSSPGNIPGNDDSWAPKVIVRESDSHILVLFQSKATNFTGATGRSNIYLRDVTDGTLSRISGNLKDDNCLGALGCFSPDATSDGRFVTYLADNTQTQDVILIDRQAAADSPSRVTVVNDNAATGDANKGAPAISEYTVTDGPYVLYAANDLTDVSGAGSAIVYNHTGGTREVISVAPPGMAFDESTAISTNGPGSLSADGKVASFTAYLSYGFQYANTYLRDRNSGTTTLIGNDNIVIDAQNNFLLLSSSGFPAVFSSLNYAAPATQSVTYAQKTQQSEISYFELYSAPAPVATEWKSALCVNTTGDAVVFQQANGQLYMRQLDQCLSDPDKEEAGICGCGVPDTDTDDDGTPDCEDQCPANPKKIAATACGCSDSDQTGDSDGDGTADCLDLCPNDPLKTAPGSCGCGIPELDLNLNSKFDCTEAKLASPPKPTLKARKDGSLQINIKQVSGATYEIRYLKQGGKAKTGSYPKNQIVLAKSVIKKLPAGTYTITYTLIKTISGAKYKGPRSRSATFKVTKGKAKV